MTGLIVVLLVVVVALLLGVTDLALHRRRTRHAWSRVNEVLKRRRDLIPVLVEAVKGCPAERQPVDAVTAARARAVNASISGDRSRIGQAETTLTAALGSLFAVAEGSPQLRAAEGFPRLQAELTAATESLEEARRDYNDSAGHLNHARQSFPRSLLAGALHLAPVSYFQAGEAPRAAPAESVGHPPAA